MMAQCEQNHSGYLQVRHKSKILQTWDSNNNFYEHINPKCTSHVPGCHNSIAGNTHYLTV